MQQEKVTVHIEQVSKGISIIFYENKETNKRDFLIEVNHQETSTKKYKSLFYIEKFPLYEKREDISKWSNNLISNEELITKIKS